MERLLGKTLEELQLVANNVGLPKFAAKQLADWIYVRRVDSFDQMTNISLSGREALKRQYAIGRYAPSAESVSSDGTRKYLFLIPDASDPNAAPQHQFVEAVYIPDSDRATLCVSTQRGCKMGCRFCMTGTLGFHGNLDPADILNQIFEIDARALSLSLPPLSNIVYMGEGEPMDNLSSVLRSLQIMCAPYGPAWSPKRITVSSVGLPALKQFLDISDCHLAISMHNPFPTERAQFMPAERLMPLTDVIALIKQYDFSHQRRVSFEYICWAGVNDTLRHAKELIRILKGLPCRINLIRFHPGVEQIKNDRSFPASNEQQMIFFRDYLSSHGITTTIRRSRGEDILAACGMLVNDLSRSHNENL